MTAEPPNRGPVAIATFVTIVNPALSNIQFYHKVFCR